MKIAIGGMIASGKSTLVKNLSKELDYDTMDEFRQGDEVFNTLLDWLYKGYEDIEMLLQVYFLHKHYKTQLEKGNNVIVDRHIIEHWLFAQENLKHKPTILNFYNGLFHQYMNQVKHPDLYFILDMNWKEFENRIKKRGRKQEIENYEQNKEYFKNLLNNYTDKLAAQCEIYDIPYILVNVNDNDEQETLNDVLEKIYINNLIEKNR